VSGKVTGRQEAQLTLRRPIVLHTTCGIVTEPNRRKYRVWNRSGIARAIPDVTASGIARAIPDVEISAIRCSLCVVADLTAMWLNDTYYSKSA